MCRATPPRFFEEDSQSSELLDSEGAVTLLDYSITLDLKIKLISLYLCSVPSILGMCLCADEFSGVDQEPRASPL